MDKKANEVTIIEHYMLVRQMPDMPAYIAAAKALGKVETLWRHRYGILDGKFPSMPVMVVVGYPAGEAREKVQAIVEEAGGVPYDLPVREVIDIMEDVERHEEAPDDTPQWGE